MSRIGWNLLWNWVRHKSRKQDYNAKKKEENKNKLSLLNIKTLNTIIIAIDDIQIALTIERQSTRDSWADLLYFLLPFPPDNHCALLCSFRPTYNTMITIDLLCKVYPLYRRRVLQEKTAVSKHFLCPCPPATTMPSFAPLFHFVTRWLFLSDTYTACSSSTTRKLGELSRFSWFPRPFPPATTMLFLSPNCISSNFILISCQRHRDTSDNSGLIQNNRCCQLSSSPCVVLWHRDHRTNSSILLNQQSRDYSSLCRWEYRVG